MTSGVFMRISGDEDIFSALNKIGGRPARRAMRKAVRAGLKPIRSAARRNAPRDTAALAKATSSKVKTYTRVGTIVGIVGPKRVSAADGKSREGKKLIDPSVYSLFVEGGTIRGIKATRYLSRAIKDHRAAALAMFNAKAAVEVAKEVNKLRAQGAIR